ncbi:hypothetical protein PAMC26510_31375 [Caballeronia sordidicola]|uniref:Uncharacterized protein n=1 Tax=Caballeronia sordidicola TaxID=196367 RepID=A0A242M849_CABSO|nr:hypothetical protein PAMC26510_31375 [Caballeronia sordidicola]
MRAARKNRRRRGGKGKGCARSRQIDGIHAQAGEYASLT